MWNQDFVGGGGAASEAESCRHSEASYLWTGSRAHLRVLEVFGFLMLKYAFTHILETLFVLPINLRYYTWNLHCL